MTEEHDILLSSWFENRVLFCPRLSEINCIVKKTFNNISWSNSDNFGELILPETIIDGNSKMSFPSVIFQLPRNNRFKRLPNSFERLRSTPSRLTDFNQRTIFPVVCIVRKHTALF